MLTNSKARKTVLVGNNKVTRLTLATSGGPSMYIPESTIAIFSHSQWWLRYCKFAVPTHLPFLTFGLLYLTGRQTSYQFIQSLTLEQSVLIL